MAPINRDMASSASGEAATVLSPDASHAHRQFRTCSQNHSLFASPDRSAPLHIPAILGRPFRVRKQQTAPRSNQQAN